MCSIEHRLRAVRLPRHYRICSDESSLPLWEQEHVTISQATTVMFEFRREGIDAFIEWRDAMGNWNYISHLEFFC